VLGTQDEVSNQKIRVVPDLFGWCDSQMRNMAAHH
jgi:hypothetical protein